MFSFDKKTQKKMVTGDGKKGRSAALSSSADAKNSQAFVYPITSQRDLWALDKFIENNWNDETALSNALYTIATGREESDFHIVGILKCLQANANVERHVYSKSYQKQMSLIEYVLRYGEYNVVGALLLFGVTLEEDYVETYFTPFKTSIVEGILNAVKLYGNPLYYWGEQTNITSDCNKRKQELLARIMTSDKKEDKNSRLSRLFFASRIIGKPSVEDDGHNSVSTLYKGLKNEDVPNSVELKGISVTQSPAAIRSQKALVALDKFIENKRDDGNALSNGLYTLIDTHKRDQSDFHIVAILKYLRANTKVKMLVDSKRFGVVNLLTYMIKNRNYNVAGALLLFGVKVDSHLKGQVTQEKHSITKGILNAVKLYGNPLYYWGEQTNITSDCNKRKQALLARIMTGDKKVDNNSVLSSAFFQARLVGKPTVIEDGDNCVSQLNRALVSTPHTNSTNFGMSHSSS